MLNNILLGFACTGNESFVGYTYCKYLLSVDAFSSHIVYGVFSQIEVLNFNRVRTNFLWRRRELQRGPNLFWVCRHLSWGSFLSFINGAEPPAATAHMAVTSTHCTFSFLISGWTGRVRVARSTIIPTVSGLCAQGFRVHGCVRDAGPRCSAPSATNPPERGRDQCGTLAVGCGKGMALARQRAACSGGNTAGSESPGVEFRLCGTLGQGLKLSEPLFSMIFTWG